MVTLTRKFILFALFLLIPCFVFAAPENHFASVAGIRIEFIIFALTLIGVAVFSKKTLPVALTGLVFVVVFKIIFFPEFSFKEHFLGSEAHDGEWKILLNLLGLLLGFAILARYFEESGIPKKLPHYLPDDWKGPFVLLILVAVLSAFLDNIAAAMIGGAVAMVVFRNKVHIGYCVAIVAASNAGGAGSVLGDTTTTMMWIDGVNPINVLHAYVAAVAAFIVTGFFGSIQQHKLHPIMKEGPHHVKIDYKKIIAVILMLAGAILANVLADFPALGVWIAILISSAFVAVPWHEAKTSLKGSVFLLSLVACASLMPVEDLPEASWQSTLALGFISAGFDNIPLTKLALDQGGYDWGVLAYAVGFGGSITWFGSSAGVAISNMFPQSASVKDWVKNGWHVILAYVIGFFVLLYTLGWHPHPPHKTYMHAVVNGVSAPG